MAIRNLVAERTRKQLLAAQNIIRGLDIGKGVWLGTMTMQMAWTPCGIRLRESSRRNAKPFAVNRAPNMMMEAIAREKLLEFFLEWAKESLDSGQAA